MAKFLNRLRLPTIFGAITGNEGEVWMDTDKHQPRYLNADGTAAAFGEGDRFNRFTAGRWYPVQIGGANTTNANASRAFAVPMPLPRYAQLGGIGIEVSTAWTTAGNARVGVYADTGFAMPGTRLLDCGTVTATASVKTFATTLDLAAGMYWLVAVNQGGSGATTGQFRAVAGLHDWIGDPSTTPATTFMNGSINAYYSDTGFTGALPASFGTVAGATLGPRFVVKFNF